MNIIAIDPGSVQSALVGWDGKSISLAFIMGNYAMGTFLHDFCTDPKTADGGHLYVIELVGHYGSGMPAGQSVFDTCVWIGRFAQIIESSGATVPMVQLVKRQTVKLALCGHMRAKDSNIRQALIDRFGAPGTKKNPGVTYGLKADLWQAFALAVCVYDAESRGEAE